MVLCAKSRWFRAALTGGFSERFGTEIKLDDDDPEALDLMLRNSYSDKPSIPDTARGLDEITSHRKAEKLRQVLAYYQAIDKYQFDGFLEGVEREIDSRIRSYLDHFDKDSDESDQFEDEFISLVRTIYDMASSRGTKHPLFRRLVSMVLGENWPGIIIQHDMTIQQLYRAVAAEVPEFGRDVFVGILEMIGHQVPNPETQETRTIFLSTSVLVRCPICSHTQMRLYPGPRSGGCGNCGKHQRDWDKFQTKCLEDYFNDC